MAQPPAACYIWRMQTPFDPKSPEMRRRRFRPIPVRMLVPNVITLLAICAGLTAIRLSTEGRMELAVAAIVFAAVLDGVDGRVARMIKGQSKFGAELDSLADFVNFGVAPGLILYFWQLHESEQCRLDRRDGVRDLRRPAAGALQRHHGRSEQAGLCGEFLHRRSGARRRDHRAAADLSRHSSAFRRRRSTLTALYTLLIAFLMVSRLPVFSGKTVRMRVPPEMVLPVFVSVIFFIALLIGYPWHILSVGSVLYLLSLPWGWKAYRDHERAAAARPRRRRPMPPPSDPPRRRSLRRSPRPDRMIVRPG